MYFAVRFVTRGFAHVRTAVKAVTDLALAPFDWPSDEWRGARDACCVGAHLPNGASCCVGQGDAGLPPRSALRRRGLTRESETPAFVVLVRHRSV